MSENVINRLKKAIRVFREDPDAVITLHGAHDSVKMVHPLIAESEEDELLYLVGANHEFDVTEWGGEW